MKIVSIIPMDAGIAALTDEGEIYYGFFNGQGEFHKPKFGWRKAPSIPKECYSYELMKEPTLDELKKRQIMAYEEQEKLKDKLYVRPKPLPPSGPGYPDKKKGWFW